jgi:hypothetical protein
MAVTLMACALMTRPLMTLRLGYMGKYGEKSWRIQAINRIFTKLLKMKLLNLELLNLELCSGRSNSKFKALDATNQ